MSIEVAATVVGAAEVATRFERGAADARPVLRTRVQGLGIKLQRKVKSEKLTGQVLHVRSGRLRRNINEQTTETAAAVQSSVGTNVVYGRAWELGFERRRRASGLLGRLRARLGRGSMRRYGPRPFLRPSLEEMRPEIVATLQAAAVAVAKGQG